MLDPRTAQPLSHSVGIVDTGSSNAKAVANMLRRIGQTSLIISSPEEIARSQVLIVPGVGSFDSAMRHLNQTRCTDDIRDHAESGKPLLGICLGMQLLFDASDEGVLPGLGILRGGSARIDTGDMQNSLPVPHMGWSTANFVTDHPGFCHMKGRSSEFYFVHSFAVQPVRSEDVMATTTYGRSFVSAVASANIVGVQFHPEKSHRHGFQLLNDFCMFAKSSIEGPG